MKLAAYIHHVDGSARSFADRVGVPTSTITRILRGERKPGFSLMRRISKATEGKVSTLADFEADAKQGDAA